jgi:hypothetical protein
MSESLSHQCQVTIRTFSIASSLISSSLTNTDPGLAQHFPHLVQEKLSPSAHQIGFLSTASTIAGMPQLRALIFFPTRETDCSTLRAWINLQNNQKMLHHLFQVQGRNIPHLCMDSLKEKKEFSIFCFFYGNHGGCFFSLLQVLFI